VIVDEAKLERDCICLLQRVDRGDHSVETPRTDAFGASSSMVVAMGWMYLDLERATRELEFIVGLQLDDGLVPKKPGGSGTALPFLASLFRMVYHAARGRQRSLEPRLAALVPPVDRFHKRLGEADRRRLLVSSPDDDRVCPTSTEPVIDVGINALLTQAESDLADVAIHTGYPTRAVVARRTHRAQALAEQLWLPEHRAFAPRTLSGDPMSVALDAALPLWAGAALRHQAASLVETHLSRGRGFWTRLPLATDLSGGAVDPLLNWLLVRGLLRYGHEEAARELSEATLQLVAQNGLAQAYDSQSGKPVGELEWAPTAAVALDLLKTPFDYDRW
jgi:hypothetical protein